MTPETAISYYNVKLEHIIPKKASGAFQEEHFKAANLKKRKSHVTPGPSCNVTKKS